jgi:hypothetical protein
LTEVSIELILSQGDHMTRITIPRELAERKDLVAVPRDTYDEFVAWQRTKKSTKMFSATPQQKKALAEARKNRTRGKYTTLDELRRRLATGR